MAPTAEGIQSSIAIGRQEILVFGQRRTAQGSGMAHRQEGKDLRGVRVAPPLQLIMYRLLEWRPAVRWWTTTPMTLASMLHARG